MKNVACYVSKQKMLWVVVIKSSATAATPTVHPDVSQDGGKYGTGPTSLEMPIKGMVCMGPASCIFPYTEKHETY